MSQRVLVIKVLDVCWLASRRRRLPSHVTLNNLTVVPVCLSIHINSSDEEECVVLADVYLCNLRFFDCRLFVLIIIMIERLSLLWPSRKRIKSQNA